MSATTAIAVFGAGTGSLSLGIQAATWWASRTRLKLDANPGIAEVSAGSDGAGGYLSKEGDVIFLRITNKSPHPVKISHVGAIDAADTQKGYFVPRPYPLHLSLPFEIPARDNRTLWMARDDRFDKRLRFTVITMARPFEPDQFTSMIGRP